MGNTTNAVILIMVIWGATLTIVNEIDLMREDMNAFHEKVDFIISYEACKQLGRE